MGLESGIGFFTSSSSAHAMVLVHLDSLGDYGYFYYEDLSAYDFSDGQWIIVEPQTTIGNQCNERIGEYSVYMAVEVDYDKATS